MKDSNTKEVQNFSKGVQDNFLERILIKVNDKDIFIDTDRIRLIESAGNYIKLCLFEGDTHMVRGSLKGLEQKLNPYKFIRIHRSYIININGVKAIEPWFSGDSKVILKDGTKLKMSRNYKDNLDRFKVS